MEEVKNYDICNLYNKILKTVVREEAGIKRYLCEEGEPPVNDRLKEMLDRTIENLHSIIRQTTVIIQCFDYEIGQYEKSESLLEEEKNDRETCRVLRWQMWRIEQSFRSTSKFLSILCKRCEEYRFSGNTTLLKAVSHACKNHNKRCRDCFQNTVKEYILKCILRPYYIKLINSGKNFEKDIREHVNCDGIRTYEEYQERYAPYIKSIADFAEASGNKNYQTVRKEEYETIEIRRRKVRKIQKAEQEKKKEIQYQERMEKFCRKKEEVYQRHISEKGKDVQIMKQVFIHPEYTPEKVNCCYIACLIKPEKGSSYFRYLTTKGLKEKAKEVDQFFFDGYGVKEALEACYSYPDVKAADTVRVY